MWHDSRQGRSSGKKEGQENIFKQQQFQNKTNKNYVSALPKRVGGDRLTFQADLRARAVLPGLAGRGPHWVTRLMLRWGFRTLRMAALWIGRICLRFLPKHDMGKGKKKKADSWFAEWLIMNKLRADSYRSSNAPQDKPESDQKSWVSSAREHVPPWGRNVFRASATDFLILSATPCQTLV